MSFSVRNHGGFQDLPGGELLPAGQRMLRGGKKVAAGRGFPGNHVIPVINVLIQGVDQIHLVLIQKAEHFFRAGSCDLQGDLRELQAEGPEPGLHDMAAERIRHGDTDGSPGAPELVGALPHALSGPDDLVGVFQKLRPFGGQLYRMIDSFKKLYPKLCLQLADLGGHGGLGIAQLLRGPGKTLQFCDLNKTFQCTDFHRYHHHFF